MRVEFRLGLVWFLYFAGFGLYFPFWSLYLTENAGLSGGQAGFVIAALSLMGMLSQPFWGQIADRTGSRTRVMGIIALGAGVGFLGLFLARGFLQLLFANALFAAFHTAMMPMTVAVSLALLRDHSHHTFGIVRSLGTISFVVMALAFPRLLDAAQADRGWNAVPGGPSEPGLEWMFPVSAAFALLAALATLTLPRTGAVSMQAARGDWRALLRHGPYVRLALFSIAAYFFTHAPMLFFPSLVTASGGTLETVSNMWLPMVALEIPGLMLSGVLFQRFGPRGLMAIGLFAVALRWTLSGFAPSLPLLYATSFLHGVTVAGLMMGTPLYIEAAVPERLRATGQGLIAACVHFGAMMSSLVAGQLIDAFDIEMPYKVGGLASFALLLLMPWILPPPHRPEGES